MLIPQYTVLVLKVFPDLYGFNNNTAFLIPQNQCYAGTPCTTVPRLLPKLTFRVANGNPPEKSFRFQWTMGQKSLKSVTDM